MKHVHSLEEVALENAQLTIGEFDGVHCGHRKIIEKLVDGARKKKAPAVVLTFDPHPASVLTGREIKYLTTPAERADLFAELGVDYVITQAFTLDLSNLSAYEFMTRLKKH